MIKTVLIDDEPLSREIIKSYLKDYPQFEVVEECNDGFEGVKTIGQHQPDLIFLDVQMPKINGFEMLELLGKMPSVIFTTAFDEYAIKAFEANAIDYLLKPFSRERFDKAIARYLEKPADTGAEKAVEQMNNMTMPVSSERIVVKDESRIKIIPVQDIEFLEADDDYIKIYTREGCFMKNKTMQYYEDTLNPSVFVRVHRSYILNISCITRIDPYKKENHLAILQSGYKIPVSKTGYPKLKAVLQL